ncbi:primosomal protein [Mycolicibacterium sp. 018/SC-01/001]|uniref:protein export chaperone SatS n=1 Tax=Mycolicibacterium sp. 018/SC-01/001 TaxID=2592069 RepID=UPI00117C0633|nr:primosomal protein [Mycolicibacterium sp. 018/SC-01/001]TRW79801.1 primosomal protein [Mycolicibacterium sp. 018/SC-01/001]
MAADIVPIGLSLTKGDVYTLWAPRWRADGDEWEAFLGKDEDLYVLDSVADLAAFVRTNTDNDLIDHPAWEKLTTANAHQLTPDEEHSYDLAGFEEILSNKPTEDSVRTLHRALSLVSSIGSVCELPAVTKFFNGNPVLGTVGGGVEAYAGRAGRKRWAEIEKIINRGWDAVIESIDEIIAKPEVDSAAVDKAQAELDAPAPEPEEDEVVIDDVVDTDEEADELAAAAEDKVLGSDEDFWARVGIDPLRMMLSGGTFFTLRCYLDDRPIFLGRNGRISVFGSERALARYLADEHDHDLSDLATYDDIRTAATDGSLRVEVTDDNIYVLFGIVDDLAEGPDALDHDQLELAVELLRDIADYAEDTSVAAKLDKDTALGRLIASALEPGSVSRPSAPYAEAVTQWESLERFVESRLRSE